MSSIHERLQALDREAAAQAAVAAEAPGDAEIGRAHV